MKFKWMNKRLTFMIIPDANSNVLRFRMTSFMLYLAISSLAVIVIFSLIVYIVHLKTTLLTHSLQNQLYGQTVKYEHTVTEKDTTIEQLQSEVIQLSQQAEEIKGKVGVMEKLDEEMRKLTGSTAATNPNATDISTGKGGPNIPATNDDILNVARDTKSRYASIDTDMTKLFTSLEETKQKVLAAQQELRITPTIWPTDFRTVTSDFGYRQDPFTFKPTFHSGVDIGGELNSPVFVTADGIVVFTGYDSERGNNIIVDHSNGLRTRYLHLNKIVVEMREHVEKGQKIGLLGSTGRSTGPHIHYEVIKNGVTIDPKPYLKASRKEE